MKKADLHIHTEFSLDGEYPVADIVAKCVAAGVGTFTVSDHNNVEGNYDAARLAAWEGLSFVPGIEIDCVFEGTELHLLGFNIDWKHPDFKALQDRCARMIMESFEQQIANLAKLGIHVETDEVLAKAAGKLPSGELIAETLLSDSKYDYPQLDAYRPGGARSDMPYVNFYLDYFQQDAPAYVKLDYISFGDAVELIRTHGGTPVVAHPGLNFKGREDVSEALLANGAEGLEVFNNYHTEEQAAYFAKTVVSAGKLMTCGSDFHGKTKPVIEIGGYMAPEKYNDYLSDSVARLVSQGRAAE